MKILVVSAYYPPHHIGGYEIGCRDVVNKLRQRGHEVLVLTGDFKLTAHALPEETNVLRSLQRELPGQRLDKKKENKKFVQTLRHFNPDLVYFWSQSELCFWFPLLAHWRGYRLAFFLSDTTFTSWCVGAWLERFARGKSIISKPVRVLFGKTFLVRGWPVIQNRACHFASAFLRTVAEKNQIRIAGKNSAVAHWGIEPSQFMMTSRERWPVKRLLYVGQMIPQKGVHTAIAAFGQLVKEKGFETLTLTLAGSGIRPDYEQKLRELTAQLNLTERVSFLGKVPRMELSRVYAEHDVLIFPSEWDEPFAITPLEAIASGLAIVGTTTGGSGELFRNRETAMTFRAGDATDCARAVRELNADRKLFETICQNAQHQVQTRHTLDAMVDTVENRLQKSL